MFSFGIVIWELLTGEEPYADLHYGAIIGILHHLLSYLLAVHFVELPNGRLEIGGALIRFPNILQEVL